MNTSAVFGFTNALLEVIRTEQPTHIAVVFDPPGPTLTEQFEAYKANRDETPEDIKLSVPWIVRILEGLRIPKSCKLPGLRGRRPHRMPCRSCREGWLRRVHDDA